MDVSRRVLLFCLKGSANLLKITADAASLQAAPSLRAGGHDHPRAVGLGPIVSGSNGTGASREIGTGERGCRRPPPSDQKRRAHWAGSQRSPQAESRAVG